MRDLKVHDNVKLKIYLRMELDAFEDLLLLAVIILFIQLLMAVRFSGNLPGVYCILKIIILPLLLVDLYQFLLVFVNFSSKPLFIYDLSTPMTSVKSRF